MDIMEIQMDKSTVRVLLVEDDRDDYLLTRELFDEMSGQQYVLDWVSDYDTALEVVCRGEHDVYLFDYRLGARDGLELLKEAIDKNCKAPAIILTGQADREIDVAAMQAGAADYLDKGRLNASILERAIRYAMRHKRDQEELENRVEERTAELARANAALKEADRRKNEFLAMLAHELRNPLAPIQNALRIIRSSEGGATTASEMMERQVGQLVRLVDDLLDVSRITRGKIELRTGEIELASSINHSVEAARPVCENGNLDLTVTLPPQPIYLNGDPTRLSQVVGNLLNNACKFTDKGGRIDLVVEREDSRAIIRVKDTGIGIDPDQIPYIFDMFVQADTSLNRSVSGLGIGLTLVKNLVELHNGTVEVYSAGLGQGSEFVVRLPILEKRGEPRISPAPSVGIKAAEVKRRILVVDDNVDSAESLAMLMEITGHEVKMAHDGLEAVEKAESFQPEVILLDIGLPKLNGYEAASKIREQTNGKEIKLIALTGWGQEEDRQRSKEAGFDAHIVKPVDHDELTKLLDSMD